MCMGAKILGLVLASVLCWHGLTHVIRTYPEVVAGGVLGISLSLPGTLTLLCLWRMGRETGPTND